jgi:8-oxo-dGTP diphosphatase
MPPRAARLTVSIDVVIITPVTGRLAVLLRRVPGAGRRWSLPSGLLRGDEALEAAATRVAREALGGAPAWMEQVGAAGGEKRHLSGAGLSICFAALAPLGTAAPDDGLAWLPVSALPPLAPRERAEAESAVAMLRARLDRSPIAFRMLPATFTLSELQSIYELLLGRRLHKASFRRALQAARLVSATDQWRREGRGRPAQLFRYAPRRRRTERRSIRFDQLPN